MNSSLWLWGGLAVTLFWCVGVYNRLARMQVRGAAALRSVEKHAHRCFALVDILRGSTSNQWTTDHAEMAVTSDPELTYLLTAVHALDQTLKDARGGLLGGQSVAKIGIAFEATQQAWRNWVNVQQQVDQHSIPDDMQAQWDAATLRIRASREGLNHILSNYNEAIAQFPARMLVHAMGFKPTSLM
ncbi:MAG: hypothetical protein IPN06_13970 [Burkholderiales bacterium]|jgi:hypothetical protein|nr:hypothetical protein [Burkholderiales bacterium]